MSVVETLIIFGIWFAVSVGTLRLTDDGKGKAVNPEALWPRRLL